MQEARGGKVTPSSKFQVDLPAIGQSSSKHAKAETSVGAPECHTVDYISL